MDLHSLVSVLIRVYSVQDFICAVDPSVHWMYHLDLLLWIDVFHLVIHCTFYSLVHT